MMMSVYFPCAATGVNVRRAIVCAFTVSLGWVDVCRAGVPSRVVSLWFALLSVRRIASEGIVVTNTT